MSSRGQIVLPAKFRRRDEVERSDRGDCRPVRRTAPPNAGVVGWLLACPEKGFFVPIASESTDCL